MSLPDRGEAATEQATPSRLRVTNPQRVIDAATGTTKIELVRYDGLVGALMMKHLKGRPVSLVRAPDGVGGPLFFQKHAETDKLEGIRQLDPTLYISHPPMIEVDKAQGLLSAAQWNVVEFHTLNTGMSSFEHPDRLVFDLDPGEGVPWAQVQEAALGPRASSRVCATRSRRATRPCKAASTRWRPAREARSHQGALPHRPHRVPSLTCL